jgi:hypothetical protein
VSVIATKLLAQATGLDADDGIGHRIERLRPPENFKCDAIAFEALATSSEGLVNDVLQKPLTAPRLNERGAFQYAAQLFPDEHPVTFAELKRETSKSSPSLQREGSSARPIWRQMIL